MRSYSTLPAEVRTNWPSTEQRHEARATAEYHYHDVEEWLEVIRGELTFSTLGGKTAVKVVEGGVFHIPRGEVHRVNIGPEGAVYRMFLPVSLPAGFAIQLTPEEVAVLRDNLQFPIKEEAGDRAFFEKLLSADLVFITAGGDVVSKSAFIAQLQPKARGPSDTIYVLNKTATGLLLAMIVTTAFTSAERKLYRNVRFFKKGADGYVCQAWINHPEVEGPPL